MTVGRTIRALLLVSASILTGCTGGEASIDEARTAQAVDRTAAVPELRATLESDGYTGGVTVVELRLDELRALGDLIAAADVDGGRLDAPVVAAAWLGTTDPAPNTGAFIDAYRDDPGLEAFGQNRADYYAMAVGVTVALLDPARAELEQHFASSTSLADFDVWLGTTSITRTAISSAYNRLDPEEI